VAAERVQLPGTLEEGVWSLAYASTADREVAARVGEVFERAAADGGQAVLFRRWWQEKTLAFLPPGAVVAPWATAVHQAVADRLAEWGLLGEEPLLLPCPGCGQVFMSKPPRFARTCGRCRPYTPTAKRHPAASRVMFSAGFYPSGPYGPKQGQSVLCGHPECLTFFLASSPQQRYCDQHHPDRKGVARARERAAKPKYERVRFYPLGDDPVQIGVRDSEGGERLLTVQRAGYRPRDETEFLQLLGYVSLELLGIRWAD
jgi:hypothetical protein